MESYVEKEPAFALAASIPGANLAPELCRQQPVDLILMDVQTENRENGLSAAARIKKERPQIKLLVVTSLLDAEVLRQAKAIGADSLWYKDHSPQELMDVVARTMDGEHIFPDRAPNVEIGSAWSDELSEMQKNILRLYIRGNSYSAIGRKLFIEEVTVKYHMNQMIQKCGFRTKQELIAAAIESTVITALGDD